MGSLSDEFKSKADEYALQRIKFETLRDTLGNYGNFKYVNWYDFLDPNNQNWNDYTYKTPGGLFSTSQGRVSAGTPAGIFINNIRNAKTINDVYKQSELWNSFDPLGSRDRARKYFRLMFGGKEPDPVQATAGDAQGVQADTPAPDQPPQYGGPLVRRQRLQEAIENSNDNNPWLGGNYGSRRPGWGLVEENFVY